MKLFPPPLALDALSASGAGLWECDLVNDRLRGDRTLAALLHLPAGFAREGVPIARFYDSVHPDDRGFLDVKRSLAIGKGRPLVAEFRTVPSSRGVRRLLARGRYETDTDGQVIYGRGIVVDVTESRQLGVAKAAPVPPRDHEPLTALDHVADHVLAARRAIDELGVPGLHLRPAVDALLMQVGRQLSDTLRAKTDAGQS